MREQEKRTARRQNKDGSRYRRHVSRRFGSGGRWEYTYILVAGMTLAAMKDITGHTAWMCLGGVAFALLLPYYKQEKT